MSDEDIILNWNDSILYRSDLNLLNENQWLNDRIIGFFYEYMEREKYKNEIIKIAFVNPSTVQYLKMCSSMTEADICFLSPLELNQKDFVFFPINDNQNNERAGGSHWSLIFLDIKNKSFIHLDSVGSNKEVAQFFCNKFKKYFGVEKIIENFAKFPKQSNSSDCGVYVIVGTEIIVDHLILNNYKFNDLSIDFGHVTRNFIRDSRKRFKNIIVSI